MRERDAVVEEEEEEFLHVVPGNFEYNRSGGNKKDSLLPTGRQVVTAAPNGRGQRRKELITADVLASS